VLPVTRPATADDLNAVLSLLGETGHGGLPLSPAATERVWADAAGQPGRTLLVHERGGRVAGTVDCQVVAHLARDGRPVMFVENLAVAAGDRRAGVGRALMRSAERLARGARCYKMQLLAADEAHVHAFYRACGFTACPDGFRKYVPVGAVGASL